MAETTLRAESRRPTSVIVIAIVSLILLLPALRIGFLLDDYIFLADLEGHLPGKPDSDRLFDLIPQNPALTAQHARDGLAPWWIDENVKFVFFRPVSEALFRLDYRLFGKSALGYHLHSLAWWLATLVSVALVLRIALPGPTGTLALLLFALGGAHLLPAAWISNRNALVALAPAFLGLWAHVRWREKAWRPGFALSLAGVTAGLLGGEVALGVLGYVIAYETFAPGRIGTRVRAALPVVAVGLAYVGFYRWAGYGTAASGIYLDPVSDPIGFLLEAPVRVLSLLSGAVVCVPADLWLVGLRRTLMITGSVAVVAVILMLRACARRCDASTRRSIAWLVGGAALALVPVLSTFPSDRLMLASAPGLAALLASTLLLGWNSWRARRDRPLVASAATLAVLHFAVAPALVLATESMLAAQARAALEAARSDALSAVQGAQVVLPLAPDYVVGVYLPLLIDHVGGPTPSGWRVLSLAPYDLRVTRTGPRTLELEVIGGTMMRTLFEELYRSRTRPLSAGTSLDRGLYRVEILADRGGAPTRVAFSFDRELDDPSLRFLEWREGSLRRASPFAVGETRILRRTVGPIGY